MKNAWAQVEHDRKVLLGYEMTGQLTPCVTVLTELLEPKEATAYRHLLLAINGLEGSATKRSGHARAIVHSAAELLEMDRREASNGR